MNLPIILAAYTLVVVTHGAEVRQSSGFETLHICEEARSMLVTGMTIPDAAESEKRAREERAKADKMWRAANPGRKPRADDRCVEEGTTVWPGPFCTIRENGLVYDEQALSGMAAVLPSDIKFSQCLIEPGMSSPAKGVR
jgi:hypothetical protein